MIDFPLELSAKVFLRKDKIKELGKAINPFGKKIKPVTAGRFRQKNMEYSMTAQANPQKKILSDRGTIIEGLEPLNPLSLNP